MKNFLLFIALQYSPNGGMEDFVQDFDTLDEAIAASNEILLKRFGRCDAYDTVNSGIWNSSARKYAWLNGQQVKQ